MNDFWKSAGMHLVEVSKEGWLGVTPDFLRAYYTRPEVHPIETSCGQETKLFEELMADPYLEIGKARLATLEDQDAAYNYEVLLGFRSHLLEAGSIEGAYLKMMRSGGPDIPPVFVDQLVHLIVRNILKDCDDPIRLRVGEMFFREQNVSTDDGRVMLADEEIISMHAATGGLGGLGNCWWITKRLCARSNSTCSTRPTRMPIGSVPTASTWWSTSGSPSPRSTPSPGCWKPGSGIS